MVVFGQWQCGCESVNGCVFVDPRCQAMLSSTGRYWRVAEDAVTWSACPPCLPECQSDATVHRVGDGDLLDQGPDGVGPR
jgi:hypothetical protein